MPTMRDFRLRLPRLFSRAKGADRVHYLHIGKTAGNQIKAICEDIERKSGSVKFELHGHGTNLNRIPEAARYFFSIRHPVTRFKSAFYERKRQGRRGGNLWSASEALSFQYFDHAVDLAEALYDDSHRGLEARGAMHSIQHLRRNQYRWFEPNGFFLQQHPPVWILRQEQFDDDVAQFVRRLGLEQSNLTRADDFRAKVASYADLPDLTKKAVSNLERWYSADIEFYKDCVRWISENSNQK